MPPSTVTRPSILAAACVLLALAPSPARAAGDSVATALDGYLAARTRLGRFSGAVLVARRGEVLLRKGYGFADVERRVPFTPETQLCMASISKMFTAMAALELRDRGRLALSDSLGRLLPGAPATWRGITVAQLIHHTSGIPDYEERLEIGSKPYLEFMGRRDAAARIVADAMGRPLDFAPDSSFKYSNTGYVVLATVIERAAREPFARFVERVLLRPAGMTRSGFFGASAPAQLAIGYTHGDLGWERVLGGVPLDTATLERVPRLPLLGAAGDAGLYSTVDDLYRWSLAMDGGGSVPAAHIAEVFTPGRERYGCGWFVDQGFDRRRYRHNGSLPGYGSDLIKFPDDGITIVLLSNLDRARMSTIARDLSAIALGRPYDPPVEGRVVALDTLQLARLEGRFRTTEGHTLTIRRDPAYLVAALEGFYQAGLIPFSPTEFYMPLSDGRARFTLGEDGRAIRVNLRYGGADHVAERIAE